MPQQTDVHLDRALKSAGHTPTGANIYSNNSGTTFHTDGDHYKKTGGSWTRYVPGQKIKK